jgi:hypothetical protein
MTEIGPEEAEKRKESDEELASTAKKLLWNRKTPFFATFGVALTFTIRAFACDYTEPVPTGLDFQWYGEHCGPGHGSDKDAIDELDAACERHDAAYKENKNASDVTN